jgi:hypothetical protein
MAPSQPIAGVEIETAGGKKSEPDGNKQEIKHCPNPQRFASHFALLFDAVAPSINMAIGMSGSFDPDQSRPPRLRRRRVIDHHVGINVRAEFSRVEIKAAYRNEGRI